MEYASIGKIEPDHFGRSTQINLGDATLLTSLLALNQNRLSIMIDPNIQAAANLLGELSSGTPVFSFLDDDKHQSELYGCILKNIFDDTDRTEEIRGVYRNLWTEVKNKLDSLILVNSTIENVVKQVKKPFPVADLITYYYPYPQYSPLFKSLELAVLLLKPEGEFEVISESKGVTDAFEKYAGEFVTRSGYVRRIGNGFKSGCELALGRKGHYEINIKNKENLLFNYISSKKNRFGFQAMAFLGFVR